ncbi:MAG TPA: patatin-like phospholipase family protein, partial [Nitrososphaeraceae archaeon]|nr:patatin-like phospholipase family protein [Nitrososphaeraceae archaeon]
VGVLKALSKKIMEEDEKNAQQGRPLFDVIAGTSIGAMNAAVLVSNVVGRNKTWIEAIGELERFWKVGIALKEGTTSDADIPPLVMFPMFAWWKPWKDKWNEKKIEGIASEELARRYYSTKYFVFHGKKVFSTKEIRPDFKFLDGDNKQLVLNDLPLQERIKEFGEFPIATSFERNQPRLLITALDIAEGVTVTFDSYKKEDGTMKTTYLSGTKYGYIKNGVHTNNNKSKNNYEADFDPIVIKYEDGIEIEHVMASGTFPEYYDPKIISNRKFWDGGLLSNTPLKELLESHREYWMNVENKDEAPDLDVYVVNLHPSSIDINNSLSYYDEIKDRNNDIIYGDRTYSEQYSASVIADYAEFIKELKHLALNHIKEDNDKEAFEKEIENLKTREAENTSYMDGRQKKYEDILRGRFKITKMVRIERKYNPNTSTSFKGGDITSKTIEEMIKEGENDATIEIFHNGS